MSNVPIILSALFYVLSADPISTTKYGTVYGQTYVSRDGTPVDIYQGIPFAKPPVGKLRFEKPQPADRWFKPLTTQNYSSGCIPCMAVYANPKGTVSEDCLYLNVWTPSETQNNSAKLPVMVFIHGGGFYFGQAFALDSKKFADIYASQGIVVVTIQYRLAQFGFMTLNDTVLPANLGMWDQNMALQWSTKTLKTSEYYREVLETNKSSSDAEEQILRRIGNCCDPTRITIWGESAGAMSVSQHTISPHSRDLFQQSIQVSGSTFSVIGDNHDTIPYTKKLIQELGCANATYLKSCLQSKSVSEFQEAAVKLNYCIVDDINPLALTPIQDGIFWPTNYASLVTKDHAKPTLMGLNQVEGRLFSLYEDPASKHLEFPFALLMADWPNYNATSFRHFLTRFVTASGYSNDSQTVADEIVKFATRSIPSNPSYKFWIEQFVQPGKKILIIEKYHPFSHVRYTATGPKSLMITGKKNVISDFMFNVPVLRELVAKSEAGYPTYAFLLDHFNRETWPADYPAQGSNHVGEFPYVFEMKANFDYTYADNVVKQTIQEAILAFLKTGNPSTPSMEWNQFGPNMEYLSLQEDSIMDNGFFADSYNFWTKTMRKYDFDFITQNRWQS